MAGCEGFDLHLAVSCVQLAPHIVRPGVLPRAGGRPPYTADSDRMRQIFGGGRSRGMKCHPHRTDAAAMIFALNGKRPICRPIALVLHLCRKGGFLDTFRNGYLEVEVFYLATNTVAT
jgi:hypothetical protein